MTENGNGSDNRKRNGNGAPTLLGVGKMVLAQLPPAFLLLVVINTGFLYFMMDFMEKQMESRMQLALKIIDHCMERK